MEAEGDARGTGMENRELGGERDGEWLGDEWAGPFRSPPAAQNLFIPSRGPALWSGRCPASSQSHLRGPVSPPWQGGGGAGQEDAEAPLSSDGPSPAPESPLSACGLPHRLPRPFPTEAGGCGSTPRGRPVPEGEAEPQGPPLQTESTCRSRGGKCLSLPPTTAPCSPKPHLRNTVWVTSGAPKCPGAARRPSRWVAGLRGRCLEASGSPAGAPGLAHPHCVSDARRRLPAEESVAPKPSGPPPRL